MPRKSVIDLVKDFESTLQLVLSKNTWTREQHNLYKIVKTYSDNYEKENKKYETRDDIDIIRNNLISQYWYKVCTIKPALNILFDSMSLETFSYSSNEHAINYILVMNFDKFNLSISFYKNKKNECINYYIYFENFETKNKAYLCYYTKALKFTPSKELLALKIPEFDKIYQVTDISPSIFTQFDLVCFFSEIIFYYDESGEIGNINMTYSVSQSLNQLISTYTKHLMKKINSY